MIAMRRRSRCESRDGTGSFIANTMMGTCTLWMQAAPLYRRPVERAEKNHDRWKFRRHNQSLLVLDVRLIPDSRENTTNWFFSRLSGQCTQGVRI